MDDRVLIFVNVSNPDRLPADSGWILVNLPGAARSDRGLRVGGRVASRAGRFANPALPSAGRSEQVHGTVRRYGHYLPFSLQGEPDPAMDDRGLGLPVVLQFLTGASAGDRVLVQSETAQRALRAAAHRHGVDLGGRVPPPRDPRLVASGQGPVELPGGRPAAVYNHRLYGSYGTERLIPLVRRLTSELSLTVRVLDWAAPERSGQHLISS